MSAVRRHQSNPCARRSQTNAPAAWATAAAAADAADSAAEAPGWLVGTQARHGRVRCTALCGRQVEALQEREAPSRSHRCAPRHRNAWHVYPRRTGVLQSRAAGAARVFGGPKHRAWGGSERRKSNSQALCHRAHSAAVRCCACSRSDCSRRAERVCAPRRARLPLSWLCPARPAPEAGPAQSATARAATRSAGSATPARWRGDRMGAPRGQGRERASRQVSPAQSGDVAWEARRAGRGSTRVWCITQGPLGTASTPGMLVAGVS